VTNKDKLVYGWGINDVDYRIVENVELPKVNGKRCQRQVWTCPYYDDWKKMLLRCLHPKEHQRRPTYKDCTVESEWKYLSNFVKWVDFQPNKGWKDCQLDKDFLIEGNKHYGPETCVYIPRALNLFIVNRANHRGDYMLGVHYDPKHSKKNPFSAQCSNPFIKTSSNIGLFNTELEAHKAWQAKKHEYALKLADMQDDERVAKRLREMYSPETDWTYK
jgi:hypothetical protein